MHVSDEIGERELVAACMFSGGKCSEILDQVNNDDIFHPGLAVIYKAISDVFTMTGDSTISTVRAKLIEQGNEKHIDLLMELLKEYPLVFVQPVVDSIKALSTRRKLNAILIESLESGLNTTELTGITVNKLLELCSPKQNKMAHISHIIENEIINKDGYLKTVSWIDANIAGFKRGNLVVIGARTHVGKTVTCVELARACSRDYNVMFFTLEMGRDQISRMLLTQLSGVPTDHIQHDAINDTDKQLFDAKRQYAMGLNLHIIHNVRTVGEIATLIRAHSMRKKVDFIIIDYLQRIYANDTKQSRYLQVGEVCKTLKDIAGDIGACIITPSQLSRQSDQSENEPELTDMRESGDIENDADVVLLVWKPKKEGKNIVVKCPKNRNNGIFFRQELSFDHKYLKFIEDEVRPFEQQQKY